MRGQGVLLSTLASFVMPVSVLDAVVKSSIFFMCYVTKRYAVASGPEKGLAMIAEAMAESYPFVST